MRDLDFDFGAEQGREGAAICEPQITQVWRGHDLLLTALITENLAALISGTYCRVDDRLHLGYAVELGPDIPIAHAVFRLTYCIRGLNKVRPYEIVLERSETYCE